jgi:hypothetical protein
LGDVGVNFRKVVPRWRGPTQAHYFPVPNLAKNASIS